MKYRFLGGASKIGSSGLLLDINNSSLIIEYGLTPDSPPKYPIQAPPVDYAFLSHAHLDHSGMTPWLTNKYELSLYATDLTLALAQILLRDNIKISEIEGYPSMYSKLDIRRMLDDAIELEDGKKYKFNNFDMMAHDAGHIPGSVMFQLKPIGGSNILVTCDINTIDTRLVQSTRGIECDILFLEATYAGRDHELRTKIEYNFQEKVKEIVERNGQAIIPAFAVGRTQEVLLILADLDYEIWLDGLGGDVTRLFLKYPKYLKDHKKLKKIFERVRRVRTRAHRKAALEGEVIVTTSGMLDGGPALRYIQALNDNSKNGILLTGYQVEGANGRMLLEHGKLRLYDSVQKINMEVEHFDFSAHAGHKDLVNFAKKCNPEHIILYHGEERELLKNDLENLSTVHLPDDGHSYEL
jgi:putative mRNA 3-end processing factor